MIIKGVCVCLPANTSRFREYISKNDTEKFNKVAQIDLDVKFIRNINLVC